ncbi:alkyl hydroperoxide reductase subunit F [Pelagicoccus sp. SDUM812003]|uniref:alkyl hydroperoxide reductase subunit F n=1 Tax=Pelagicoccus sp. SDUM812003 TaxID=3041267 RepID=UPI00280E6027|nr:alkyl hydroperoxide reductase subunit F [Pelagicoccus sp. SDUM812003]MDQ8201863.1 alkyl hydroperoxide reductase subunit F [Pelagicoccus sp. SDUM812003]
MKLSPEIVSTLKAYAEKLTRTVQFKLFDGSHPKRPELVDLLVQVTSLSDKLELIYSETGFNVREGLTFELLADGETTGIRFSGIPGGHEFNSFVLAFLQAGGIPVKLDEGVQQQVRAIDVPLSFEVFVSLDCHNCPDVVQTLNQFSVINPKISCEMIDGGNHVKLAEERNVQGVPTVFLNKKPFSSGKISAAEILSKIADIATIAPVKLAADETLYDVAVVGGGPAAAAAAIYTARKGLKVLMLAEKIGGQVNDTMGIENLIGTAKTTGPELSRNLRSHIADYSIKTREDVRVAAVSQLDGSPHWQLKLATGEQLKSKTVIIATGAKWRELGVPGEKENVGNGVAYCPHCDGPFFKGKDVVVVGGGNSGVEAALDLSGIVKSVTVVEFLDTLKADKVLADQLQKTKNATIITGAATESIEADAKGVKGLKIKNRETGESRFLPTEGVFVQIGLAPNSALVKGLVETNRFGEIVVSPRCETNQAGIYACGDVTTVPFKQIIVSMGEGAKAGLAAFEYLLKSSSNVEN